MNYHIVVLPCKCSPFSMSNVMAQFLLTVSEGSICRILHLLGFRILGLFWCKMLTKISPDWSYHNTFPGEEFIKPIKYKSNKETCWQTMSQLLILFLFRLLVVNVNLQCHIHALIIIGKSNYILNISGLYYKINKKKKLIFLFFSNTILLGVLSDFCTCQRKTFW